MSDVTMFRDNVKPSGITTYNGAGYLLGTLNVERQLVKDTNGNVTYCVDIGDTAYANGTTFNSSDNRYYGKATNPIVKKRNANANFYSVSIEVVGNYDSKLDKCTMTPEQKSAVVEIILFILREVKKRYNNDIPVDRTRI